VAGVMGNDSTVQTECTTQFRRLLSIEKNPPIQQVIEAGVVPRETMILPCSLKRPGP
jgi:importin subunit alpha-1